MNVYEVHHSGHYLSGLSIVVANSEAEAIALTIPAIKEHGLDASGIEVMRALKIDEPFCYVLNDGDY